MTDIVVVALLVPLAVMAWVLTVVGCCEVYEYFRDRLKK